jgi:hypothetical protein
MMLGAKSADTYGYRWRGRTGRCFRETYEAKRWPEGKEPGGKG